MNQETITFVLSQFYTHTEAIKTLKSEIQTAKIKKKFTLAPLGCAIVAFLTGNPWEVIPLLMLAGFVLYDSERTISRNTDAILGSRQRLQELQIQFPTIVGTILIPSVT